MSLGIIPMWRLIKFVKELWDWVSLVWLALTAIAATGLGATVITTVGAILQGLPWPLIVAVAYSMFVGTVTLVVVLDIFLGSRKRPASQNAVPSSTSPILRPIYEAWRNVEKFTVRDAALLWVDIEPHSGDWTPEVDAWIEALCAAIRKGELDFIPSQLSLAFAVPRRDEVEAAVKLQRADASASTMVRRQDLVTFAGAKGYRPKFLCD